MRRAGLEIVVARPRRPFRARTDRLDAAVRRDPSRRRLRPGRRTEPLVIEANDASGFLYGAQTLLQLLPPEAFSE